MTDSEIPLFPLSAVLLPHGRMPLQIFERRYLDLVRDCMKAGSGFGVVWIRRGAEVAARGVASLDLGDYGTYARIIDWDQLPNGLLGITIEGGERFELQDAATRADGLVLGDVSLQDKPAAQPMQAEWQPLLDVLNSLEAHPHVQRLGLELDRADAWQVGYSLAQLLPLEESVKYELLGLESASQLMQELDIILNQISG